MKETLTVKITNSEGEEYDYTYYVQQNRCVGGNDRGEFGRDKVENISDFFNYIELEFSDLSGLKTWTGSKDSIERQFNQDGVKAIIIHVDREGKIVK